MRGQDLARSAKIKLERGEHGSLVRRFDAGEWDRGHATWIEPTDEAASRGLDLFGWADLIMVNVEGSRVPFTTPLV